MKATCRIEVLAVNASRQRKILYMNEQPRTIPSPYDLDLQDRTNQVLLDLSASLVSEIEVKAKRKDLVFLALCDKCFSTAAAIYCLCNHGFVDDAFALLRVLIEGMINAVYILESDDQIAEDYVDYPMFHAWDQFEKIRAVAPDLATYVSQDEQEQMKVEYEHTCARYEKNPNRDWAKENIFSRAKFLDARAEYNIFRSLINVTWKTASAYVHSTATSLRSRITEDEKHVNISRVPTKEEKAVVLHSSNMALFTLVSLLDIRLGGKGKERWKELYTKWRVSEVTSKAPGST